MSNPPPGYGYPPQGPPPGPPAGPPPGPPPAYGYPPQSPPRAVPMPAPMPAGPPPGRGNGPLWAIVGVLGVLVLLVVGITVFFVVRSEPSEAGEVFLEAADLPGPDPFTTSIPVTPLPTTTTRPGTSAPTTTVAPTTTAAAGQQAVTSSSGAAPGLYGGTQNAGRCDPQLMVSFLEANPDKARAWVEALNSDPTLRWSAGNKVQVTQIRAYVAELTPLTLTGDTRVTNYGFSNGKPTPRQAVLQRGTAVLVDRYGVPRTKCGCGNPLTAPAPVKTTPVYRGDPWVGWNPATVVVIQETTVIINTFVIMNLDGGGYIDRPAGTTGDQDTVSTGEPPSSTSSVPSTGPSSTSSATSSTTSSTTGPTTTASTAPPSTLAPQEFCSQYVATIAKWDAIDADTVEERRQIMADFDALTAAAPAEVQADLVIVGNWLRADVEAGQLDLDNIPPDVEAAGDRVQAYLTNVCGIS